ncbi:GntR family transcriptional regulator [Noviherbaspirillum cavernae]
MDTQTARLVVALRDMIMKGEFPGGERLVEAVLSERLQASRTPVRSALLMLEQQGLVQRAQGGGYVVRKYTAREISEAIAVHANLEGMCARLVAEQGVSRSLSDELQACLDEGDRALSPSELDMDAIAAYLAANTRFHKLIVDASGNEVLKQCMEMLDRIPFASAGGMLPFQSKLPHSDDLMRFAHRQHHMLVEALRRGQSARAQALAEEHRQIALMNLKHATEHAEGDADDVLPVLRLDLIS